MKTNKLQTVVNMIVIVAAIIWAIAQAVSMWSNRPHITALSVNRNESFELENVSIVAHVGETALMRIGQTNNFLLVPNVYLNVGYANLEKRVWATWMINGIPSQCHGVEGSLSYLFPGEEGRTGNYILYYHIPPGSVPTGSCFAN